MESQMTESVIQKLSPFVMNSTVKSRFQEQSIVPPPKQNNLATNNLEHIESRKYSSGVSVGVFRSNNEVRHSLDSTLVRTLTNQGVIGSSAQPSSYFYYLYYCKNRSSCLCHFRMIERRDQFTGSSVFSILENHSVDCIQSETLGRKGEISEGEFFSKNDLQVTSDKGNRGGMIIIHKGKIHRNKGKSSVEYRRFFCKERDCSHRVIERKSDGMVCIRGFHECLAEKTPKKSTVNFFKKETLCVSITNGHLKGGKPAKNLICNGCLFLSNRKNVVLGGRKFEENTIANEYICQIKNQFKRNRNRDRTDFHCNAIIKERISDGNIILQGHHDQKCLHLSKKFYASEVHNITNGEGDTIRVSGVVFYPIGTRSMKFGKEEVSVLEYLCSCKSRFPHVACSAVVFKHLEYDTFFLTGRHDQMCMEQRNDNTIPVLPNLKILYPPEQSGFQTSPQTKPMMAPKQPIIPPPPSSSGRTSGRQTRNSQRRGIIDPNEKKQQQQMQLNGRGMSNNHPQQTMFAAQPINTISELKILSVYPGVLERPGTTINILLKCPPNLSHMIRPNLFNVYFTETSFNDVVNGPRSEVIPRTSFYFPSIQFSDQIGNEWGISGATCRIMVTLPFFFGLSGLLNLSMDFPNNIHLELRSALMVSSNINERQNDLEKEENNSKKRKIVDLILAPNEKGGIIAKNGSNVVTLAGGKKARICCFFPNKPQNPKINYAEIFMFLPDEIQDSEIEVFFDDDQTNVLGVFNHKFEERMTKFSKMYHQLYSENCQDANILVTVEVPDFIIDSESIDLTVTVGKKYKMMIKNIFQVSDEEATKDPFLMSLHSNNDALGGNFDPIFRPETPPILKDGMVMCNSGAGFNRVDSMDDMDSMVI